MSRADDKKPLPPEVLVSAMQDKIDTGPEVTRPAKVVRQSESEQPMTNLGKLLHEAVDRGYAAQQPQSDKEGRIPDLEPVRRNAEYWASAARDGGAREYAMLAMEQAVNAWKNAAYAMADQRDALRSATPARDTADLAWRLAETQKVLREFPGIRIESDYNKWLFKRDDALALGPMPTADSTSEREGK
mgnify:CR=1 FL=1